MKIMHTMASEVPAPRPKRRFHSPQLKAQVTQECRRSGASVAGVALAHGINANIVHRWLRESARQALAGPAPAFVAVTLNEPAPVAPVTAPACPPPAPEPDIRVEVRRANASIVVKWPLAGGAACAAWLNEWLR
jgi:transposase-like protein